MDSILTLLASLTDFFCLQKMRIVILNASLIVIFFPRMHKTLILLMLQVNGGSWACSAIVNSTQSVNKPGAWSAQAAVL